MDEMRHEVQRSEAMRYPIYFASEDIFYGFSLAFLVCVDGNLMEYKI